MNMSKETRFYVGGIIVVMAVVLLFSCGNAHAVNYGEPGHNPGNPGNPGVGGPPIDNGNGNGNNGSSGGTTIGDISGGSASIWSRIANTFAPTNTNQVTATGGAGGNGGSGGAGGAGGTSYSDANSSASAVTGAVTATGGATGPVSQSQTIQVGGSGTQRIKYSGSVRTVGIAPDVGSNNTAPCRVAVGVSGGWVGGALGLSGSVLDEGCDVWRDHENLVKAGFVDAATLRLCDKPEVAKVLAHCTKAVEVYPTKSGFVH